MGKLASPVSVTGLKYVVLSLENLSEIIGKKVTAPWTGVSPSWGPAGVTIPVIVEE